MKKNILVTLILLTIFMLPLSSSKTTEDPGVTPDSFLWGLDKALDQLNLLLTFNEGEKATKGLEIARERLLEVKAMIEENKLEAAEKGKDAHGKTLVKVKESIASLEEDDSIQEIEKIVEIEKELEEHEEEIEQKSGELKIKIEIKGQISQEQKDLINSILSSLENKTGEVEIEIENKKNKTKIKIKQETGKSEEEIEEEIEEIEEEKGLTAIKKERATEQIEDAREEIVEAVEEKLSKQENKFPGINAAENLISEAKSKLETAEEAFRDEDYGKAFGQANAAESLAKNAQRILEDEDMEEEGLEIEVEIKDEKAEIEVESGEEEWEFELATTNLDNIINEISARTGLSVEEINGVIKVEIEDEEEVDEFEAEQEIEEVE